MNCYVMLYHDKCDKQKTLWWYECFEGKKISFYKKRFFFNIYWNNFIRQSEDFTIRGQTNVFFINFN